MGYSCTAKADFALNAMIVQLKAASSKEIEQSNAWEYKGQDYFFEQGREQDDGSITGTVVSFTGYTVGSVRIDSEGIVKRWAKSTAIQRTAATDAGNARYGLAYGGVAFQVI